MARKYQTIDHSRTNNADGNFFNTAHGILESRGGSGDNRETCDRYGIAGKHEKVAAWRAIKQANRETKPHPQADCQR